MITLEAGVSLPPFTVEVDAASMKVFSLITGDPNPIHWDTAAVSRAGLGDRVINQGGLNAAYLVSSVSAWLGGAGTVLSTKFRFLANAYAGDTLRGGGEVAEVDGDVAVLDLWLGRNESDLVLRGTISVTLPSVGTASRPAVEESV